ALLSFGIKSSLEDMVFETRLVPGPQGLAPVSRLRDGVYRIHITERESWLLFERRVGFADSILIGSEPLAGALRDYAANLTDKVEAIIALGDENVYDLTEPVTSHFVANGLVVHNCSEYVFLDDTACNLASVNLMKFRRDDGSFDIEGYRHANRVFFLA